MMAAIFNILMRSAPEDGYLKNVHSLADGQTVTKYSAIYTVGSRYLELQGTL